MGIEPSRHVKVGSGRGWAGIRRDGPEAGDPDVWPPARASAMVGNTSRTAPASPLDNSEGQVAARSALLIRVSLRSLFVGAYHATGNRRGGYRPPVCRGAPVRHNRTYRTKPACRAYRRVCHAAGDIPVPMVKGRGGVRWPRARHDAAKTAVERFCPCSPHPARLGRLSRETGTRDEDRHVVPAASRPMGRPTH